MSKIQNNWRQILSWVLRDDYSTYTPYLWIHDFYEPGDDTLAMYWEHHPNTPYTTVIRIAKRYNKYYLQLMKKDLEGEYIKPGYKTFEEAFTAATKLSKENNWPLFWDIEEDYPEYKNLNF